MNETELVRACLQVLSLKGVLAWRNNTVGKVAGRYIGHCNGLPDILGVLPGGRFLGVECKIGKGKQSGTQVYMQGKIERAGGTYILARSIDDVIKELDRRQTP